jgi:hypothetical protein
MKNIKNNQGFALVTSLMITMISLVMIMGILTSVIQSTQLSNTKKTYQNATQAAYGGADIAAYEILPRLFGATSDSNLSSLITTMKTDFNNLLEFKGNDKCMLDKLHLDTASWTNCSTDLISSAKVRSFPDFEFKLGGVNGIPYTVRTKIVDTTAGVEYINASSATPLVTGGVASAKSKFTAYLAHYVYRIEVTAEKSSNDRFQPAEHSAVTVVYEY